MIVTILLARASRLLEEQVPGYAVDLTDRTECTRPSTRAEQRIAMVS